MRNDANKLIPLIYETDDRSLSADKGSTESRAIRI